MMRARVYIAVSIVLGILASLVAPLMPGMGLRTGAMAGSFVGGVSNTSLGAVHTERAQSRLRTQLLIMPGSIYARDDPLRPVFDEVPSVVRDDAVSSEAFWIYYELTGWPFRSHYWSWSTDGFSGSARDAFLLGHVNDSMLESFPGTQVYPAIPLGIAWRNWLLNIVIFSTVMLAIVLGTACSYHVAFRWRWNRRVQRGQCPHCGHVVIGNYLIRCTECGRWSLRIGASDIEK